jgi:hypothetical protein
LRRSSYPRTCSSSQFEGGVGIVGEGVDVVQEFTEVMVAGVRMVGVEASHCCSATGIRPGLRLLGLMADFGSRAFYRYCAVGAHYPECRKTPLIRAWEMDLVLMIKSVEINSNILPFDLHGSKLSSKLKN